MTARLYHTDYDVRLRVITREGDPPPHVVLKRVLKALLRSHGVRCRSVAEAHAATQPSPADAAVGENGGIS